jgi:hypothetical protein
LHELNRYLPRPHGTCAAPVPVTESLDRVESSETASAGEEFDMQKNIIALVFAMTGISLATIAAAQTGGSAPTFASLDSNHDGKISLNEASAHDELFVAFKKLDTNRDGELTPAEFAAYVPAK